MTPGRWVGMVVLLAAGLFAWTGGPYSQRDYNSLKHEVQATRNRIDSLQREADSLGALRDSLLRSEEVQERMARERLGMIRPGEIMIKLVRDSTALPDS